MTRHVIINASRIVTGTMGFEDAAGNIPSGRGTLYKMNDTNCFRNLDPALPNVTVSNGIAWNANGTRMYYIDSPTRQIALFDYDPATASICKVFVRDLLLLLLLLSRIFFTVLSSLFLVFTI